jgi:hypothetical protein
MQDRRDGTAHGEAGRGLGSQCRADWRRPDGYWRCDREFGHRGRHHLRAALDGRPIRIPAKDPAALVGPSALNN